MYIKRKRVGGKKQLHKNSNDNAVGCEQPPFFANFSKKNKPNNNQQRTFRKYNWEAVGGGAEVVAIATKHKQALSPTTTSSFFLSS